MIKIEIPVVNWFDESIKQSVKNVFDDINKNVEGLDLFRRYRNAHFSFLRERISNIKIFGMQSPISLKKIYATTYISNTIYGRLYAKDLTDNQGNILTDQVTLPLRSSFNGEKYIEENNRVVVLGGPGSGKTTFLRHLALSYIDKELFTRTYLKTSKFPIYINLQSLSKPNKKYDTLEGFISSQLVQITDEYAVSFIKRILNNGYAIILLDSLDEVQQSERPKVIEEIRNFCSTYPLCKVVITCRTADYDVVMQNFEEVELLKLSATSINQFIRVWFEKTPGKADRLISRLRGHKDIRTLIETPLLLCLLCIQFSHDLVLPKMKTELYRTCFDALLKEWDAQRDFRRNTAYSTLTDERKLNLFGHIAGKYFKDQVSYIFPTNSLTKYIGNYCENFNISKDEASGVLQEIEAHHGIFEKFSRNYHQFSHPSFHEYFKARNILDERTELNEIRHNLSNDKWHSVVEFTTAMSVNPVKIIDLLKQKSNLTKVKNFPAVARRTDILRLLYRCLMSGAALKPQKVENIFLYIISTQFKLYVILADKGIYPLPGLLSDKITHTYYYTHSLPTDVYVLRELGRFSNAIYNIPSKRYSNLVIEKLRNIEEPTGVLDSNFIATLGLILPLVSIRTKEVKESLKKLLSVATLEFISDKITNSLIVLKKHY